MCNNKYNVIGLLVMFIDSVDYTYIVINFITHEDGGCVFFLNVDIKVEDQRRNVHHCGNLKYILQNRFVTLFLSFVFLFRCLRTEI